MLSRIDMFGVPVKLRTHQSSPTFKNWVGGLSSLIIYSACFIYGIYILIEWQTGKILPAVTTHVTVPEQIMMEFPESVIELSLEAMEINPFDRNNLYLLPILSKFDIYGNGTTKSQQRIIFSEGKTLKVENLTLESKPNFTSYQSLLLIPCEQHLSTSDFQCADQDSIARYLSEFRNFVTMRVPLRQFDPSLNKIVQFRKEIFLVSEPEYNVVTTIRFASTVISYDSGLLFPSIEETQTVSGFQTYSQVTTENFLKNQLSEYHPIISVFFQVDAVQEKETIVKPKIGEILANIGSIFSILMMISHVATEVGSRWLEAEIMEVILSTYFTRYSELMVKRNFFGSIVFVEWNSRVLDPIKFERWLTQAKKQLESYFEFQKLIQKLIIVEKKLKLVAESDRLGRKAQV